MKFIAHIIVLRNKARIAPGLYVPLTSLLTEGAFELRRNRVNGKGISPVEYCNRHFADGGLVGLDTCH